LEIFELLKKIEIERVWNTKPVFCFTSDVDWASESVLELFLSDFCKHGLPLTVFVTHESPVINKYKEKGYIERGIHPNFLPNSSHGKGYREVIKECLKFAPEAKGIRSHRLYDVTDITHLLHDEFGFNYISNLGTILQTDIRPILHESGLVHFPIFFEDGIHLWNKLSLKLSDHLGKFRSPGIKIISVHPMNYVINTPEIPYMRKIKDSLTREEYNRLSFDEIQKQSFKGTGIRCLASEIISFAKDHNVMKLSELYELTIS
jgi:hypothetical protein